MVDVSSVERVRLAAANDRRWKLRRRPSRIFKLPARDGAERVEEDEVPDRKDSEEVREHDGCSPWSW
jgi:hypothetical protein